MARSHRPLRGLVATLAAGFLALGLAGPAAAQPAPGGGPQGPAYGPADDFGDYGSQVGEPRRHSWRRRHEVMLPDGAYVHERLRRKRYVLRERVRREMARREMVRREAARRERAKRRHAQHPRPGRPADGMATRVEATYAARFMLPMGSSLNVTVTDASGRVLSRVRRPAPRTAPPYSVSVRVPRGASFPVTFRGTVETPNGRTLTGSETVSSSGQLASREPVRVSMQGGEP
jgi:hypothetical protein